MACESNNHDRLITELWQLRRPGRGEALLRAASFRPGESIGQSFNDGTLRAAFAERWEKQFLQPVPVRQLQTVLEPPIPIGTVLAFVRLNHAADADELSDATSDLLHHLAMRVGEVDRPVQQLLTAADAPICDLVTESNIRHPSALSRVDDLHSLIEQGIRFPTMYADPPWPYSNCASRAAAVNHYPVMSLEAICREPVSQLAEPDAHLHLWTTNGFLREAFSVIEAWGFQYKSCLVWIKHELGMGNYWRVSHEYLLLGTRGRLPFRDCTLPSWIQASRTTHSRKPGIVRELVERVSPGPYLELYGREELPDSAWTVFGNQVERRLF